MRVGSVKIGSQTVKNFGYSGTHHNVLESAIQQLLVNTGETFCVCHICSI